MLISREVFLRMLLLLLHLRQGRRKRLKLLGENMKKDIKHLEVQILLTKGDGLNLHSEDLQVK